MNLLPHNLWSLLFCVFVLYFFLSGLLGKTYALCNWLAKKFNAPGN